MDRSGRGAQVLEVVQAALPRADLEVKVAVIVDVDGRPLQTGPGGSGRENLSKASRLAPSAGASLAASPWKMTCLFHFFVCGSKSYQAMTEPSVAPGSISWA